MINIPEMPIEGWSSSAESAYKQRWQRIIDCINLKQADRMPTAMYSCFWIAKYGNISCKEAMYDYDKLADLSEQICLEFEPDLMGPQMETTGIGRILEATDFKQLQWPGHGVGDHQPFQYLDKEYMTAAEYDEFLFDPTGFYLSKYLPRVAGAFDGLQPITGLSGLAYYGIGFGSAIFAMPEMQEAIGKLSEAGGKSMEFAIRSAMLSQRLASKGFPAGVGAFAAAPYDTVADYMRGAKGMMMDLFRHKDKLHEVLDKVRRLAVPQVIATAKRNNNPLVLIPIHWAPDSFMSQKQFETFFWPSFRTMMIELIDAGLVPMPLWESDCTMRLEAIKDIPAGKCIYWFEQTDMVKAFEVLGDVVALRGNISSSLLVTGKPDDIDLAVKNLVDNVWNKGGSLILDGAFGLPDETPLENARAMYDAARKYAS